MNIREALAVYNILNKYLSDVEEGEIDVLEYSHTLVQNIIKDGSDAFVRALGIMSRVSFMDIVTMDAYARTSLFIECIFVNRLWLLKQHLRRLGYGTPR